MANKVCPPFWFKQSCCSASSSENHSLNPATWLHVCLLQHTSNFCACPHAFVSVCTLYLCLRPLRRGACQDSWEGSKGEVVNQDRQEQHPGVPRMTVLLGAAGPSAQIPLWSEHQLSTVLLHSSAEARKTTFCSLALHHTMRQEPRSILYVLLGFKTAGNKVYLVHSDIFSRKGLVFHFLGVASSQCMTWQIWGRE